MAAVPVHSGRHIFLPALTSAIEIGAGRRGDPGDPIRGITEEPAASRAAPERGYCPACGLSLNARSTTLRYSATTIGLIM
jgi:hypothetical protein